MEMVNSLPFYQDVLFHAEYGTMIHSGEFSGTPGETAKQQVTALAGKPGQRARARSTTACAIG